MISVALLALMLFATSVDARRQEPMKVYASMDDFVEQGNLWEVYVTADNDEGRDKLDDVTITIMIPDLGLYYKSTAFDLSTGDVETKTLAVEMDDVSQGEYDVFIFVSNDDFSRAKHRIVTVY